MEIQLKEISLADRLQYLDSISANQLANKIKTPWEIIIGYTIGGIIVGLLISSMIKIYNKQEESGLVLT